MGKNKTYYDWLFTKTQEELDIEAQMDAERKRYRKTEEYIQHEAKIDELLNQLSEAGKRRRAEAKEHRPSRNKPQKRVDLAAFKAENEKMYQEKFNAYPEDLKNAINAYNKLDDAAKRVFTHDTYRYYPGYNKYKDPQTTKEDMKELLEILVQTTIDFINERGLKDIESIGFGADSLQESAKHGEWTPATDANIYLTGFGTEKGDNGKEYRVIQTIGEYM